MNETITISFNPLEEIFKVADAWTERWQDWIYDIKAILQWDDLLGISNAYIANYKEKYWENIDIEQKIAQRIQRVHNVKNVAFSCIEIFKTTPIEIVSEIFLRINSKGKVLNNSDFILTLMSVYREEWRKLVEQFSSYTQKRNDIAILWADEVVRVLIWVWFKRAKLEDAYNFLKWQTGEFQSLDKVIWLVTDKHQRANFLVLLKDVWFIHANLVSQQSLVIACYIFYLIGMNEYNMNFQQLNHIIKYYYVTMFLTQKYASSSLIHLWKDFGKLQKIKSEEEFISFLQWEIDTLLTGDIWDITFPKNVVTSLIRSPLFIGYTAAQIHAHKSLLFRNLPISKSFVDLIAKESLWEKIDIDLHHIFPRDYLLSTYWTNGIKKEDINQIANKVYAYNSDNKTISNKSPREYVDIFSKNGEIDWTSNLEQNAIPPHFADLPYEQFLEERRKRMILAIKKYVESIKNPRKKVKILVLWS